MKAPIDTTSANRNPLLVRPSPKLLIDARELSQLTPFGLRTIWRHVATGEIPAPMRIGGRRVWSREVIEKWIAAGCPKTSSKTTR